MVRIRMENYFQWRDDGMRMLDKHLKDLAYPRADAMLAGVPAKEGDHGEA